MLPSDHNLPYLADLVLEGSTAKVQGCCADNVQRVNSLRYPPLSQQLLFELYLNCT